MSILLLSLHVLAALIAVVPVTVAASMSPTTLRLALGDFADGGVRTTLGTLHRNSRIYAGIGTAVRRSPSSASPRPPVPVSSVTPG
nr:hypothetical protein StreXyl84_00860 [Streptomyces sp. Xyl84]